MKTLLDRCKPLSDPVRFFSKTVVAVLTATVVINTLLLSWRNYLDVVNHRNNVAESARALGLNTSTGVSMVEEFLFPLVVYLIAGSLFPLSLWLLFKDVNSKPALFLRAFATDRTSARLRRWLKSALGNEWRLCGIRPPKERSFLPVRMISWPWTALKYAGSSYFQLEGANHNWLARLLSSMTHSHFVIIDVRVMTTHVQDEVWLAALNGGLERCVFIIDDTRSREDWGVV